MTTYDMTPGCFGFPMTFEAGATECTTCPFARDCEARSAVRLQDMRDRLGIKVAERVMRPRSQTEPSEAQLAEVTPKRAAELLERIERAGIRITEAFNRGENPFPRKDSKPAFMRVACHLLLHMPGGLSRAQMKMAFASKLSWGENTAASHVSVVWHVMKAIGAADEHNGRLVARRNNCL